MALTSLAWFCPTNPAESTFAYPSGVSPRPLICEWGAIRDDRAADVALGGRGALWAGAELDPEATVLGFIFEEIPPWYLGRRVGRSKREEEEEEGRYMDRLMRVR